jgi:hypothetical protein
MPRKDTIQVRKARVNSTGHRLKAGGGQLRSFRNIASVQQVCQQALRIIQVDTMAFWHVL